MALAYSASVLDLETVACFLAVHEIKLSQRKTAKQPVDRRSSTHPAQSASVNALTSIELDRLNLNPVLIVPLTKRKILFTALKWTVVGECKYWHTLLTEKAMSGLVSVRYCRAPTRLLYRVESSGPSFLPSVILRASLSLIGVCQRAWTYPYLISSRSHEHIFLERALTLHDFY